MRNDIERVLFSEEELHARIRELGAQISKDYEGKDLLIVGILKGAVMVTADLIRSISIPINIDFMVVSSYGNSTETSGNVEIKKDISVDIRDKHVLIVEDIIDTGVTLYNLKDFLLKRNPASIKTLTLLEKKERRQVDFYPDYYGFDCPNDFVVGYGLDYAENYRHLPFIGVLKPEIYSK